MTSQLDQCSGKGVNEKDIQGDEIREAVSGQIRLELLDEKPLGFKQQRIVI